MEVDRRSGLSASAFYEEYLKPKRPVILTDFSQAWPALKNWTFDFFKERYGDRKVPICEVDFHASGAYYMKCAETMPFKDYLTLIQKYLTNKRLQNFQIMKEAPELAQDFVLPHMKGLHFFRFALLFFGGAGSRFNLHYDIDCSNVFLTHFISRKTVYLFPPEAADFLYHHPYTVQSHVDVLNLDLKRFPAFRFVTPQRAVLDHGETLFIPSLWWHYVYYNEGGYSLSLRATDSLNRSLEGAWNLARHFVIDLGMNRLFGERWKQWKVDKAQQRAEAVMRNTKPQG